MMPDREALRVRRAEALRDLARARLAPPERDEAVAAIDAALAGAGASPDATARAAHEKAAQAEADREEKRRPYEADPLFMYLWRRRYGTRDYAAGPFVRYFDRKVAHHIGYEAARVNYALLLALPDRLREHATRLAAGAAGPALEALDAHPRIAPLVAAAGRDGASDEPARRFLDADRALRAAPPEQPVSGLIRPDVAEG
ncbi:MAG TPA: hypothetical protein VGU45_15355 [Microvirga sp.]|jgi:hypothetical protein|nr:hypothetical protein [Microvirga sp.]